MINLADTVRVQGRLDEARKLAEEAVELHRRNSGAGASPDAPGGSRVLASVHRDQGRFAEAKTGYEQALAGLRRVFSPKTPELQKTLNAYAWMLATAADPRFRDPRRAIELANEVVRNTPRIREIWTTLGAAHYRAGDWKEAIAAIEKSETVAPGRFTAVNFLILAMAHWQLGEKEKARECYEKAVRSMEQGSQSVTGDLERFRREASQLVGIPDSGPTGDEESGMRRFTPGLCGSFTSPLRWSVLRFMSVPSLMSVDTGSKQNLLSNVLNKGGILLLELRSSCSRKFAIPPELSGSCLSNVRISNSKLSASDVPKSGWMMLASRVAFASVVSAALIESRQIGCLGPPLSVARP